MSIKVSRSCVRPSPGCPNTIDPSRYVANQMPGKVHGFPTTVPNADASRLPRMISASIAARTKWKPISGVKDTAAPQAKPAAIE